MNPGADGGGLGVVERRRVERHAGLEVAGDSAKKKTAGGVAGQDGGTGETTEHDGFLTVEPEAAVAAVANDATAAENWQGVLLKADGFGSARGDGGGGGGIRGRSAAAYHPSHVTALHFGFAGGQDEGERGRGEKDRQEWVARDVGLVGGSCFHQVGDFPGVECGLLVGGGIDHVAQGDLDGDDHGGVVAEGEGGLQVGAGVAEAIHVGEKDSAPHQI